MSSISIRVESAGGSAACEKVAGGSSSSASRGSVTLGGLCSGVDDSSCSLLACTTPSLPRAVTGVIPDRPSGQVHGRRGGGVHGGHGGGGRLVQRRVVHPGVVPAALRLRQQEALLPGFPRREERLPGVALAVGERLGQRLVARLGQQQDADDADEGAAGEDDVVQEVALLVVQLHDGRRQHAEAGAGQDQTQPAAPVTRQNNYHAAGFMITLGVISAQKKMLRLLTAWEENMPMMEKATEKFLFSVPESSAGGAGDTQITPSVPEEVKRRREGNDSGFLKTLFSMMSNCDT
ncbi:hypothetical protein EYF80_060596 [Liparis tanakae]|uniref:Uncharacterized protein n=1 Tax=Liparis tanakae TaxID=230148 RepID=A0A4Z2EKH7_9TELE|nr:hypothetical protein EYF80_060596 [Liparis tanakae]